MLSERTTRLEEIPKISELPLLSVFRHSHGWSTDGASTDGVIDQFPPICSETQFMPEPPKRREPAFKEQNNRVRKIKRKRAKIHTIARKPGDANGVG